MTAEQVVDLLAAADPRYDGMCCFFCHALAPIPAPDLGQAWDDSSEAHAADCPWWMARQLRGLPPWPA